MSKQTIKIEGLKELQAALQELPKATGKNIMRRVMVARAEPFAEAARGFVPVDRGFLRESINVSTRLTRRQRKMHRKQHKDDVNVFVGPGADPAAVFQEYGTSRHGPQAFMRPAFDAEKMNFIDGIREDMWVEVEKAFARIARKKARAAK